MEITFPRVSISSRSHLSLILFQTHPAFKPLFLLFSTHNLLPILAQLCGSGSSSNSSFTRKSSWISPAQWWSVMGPKGRR